MTHEAQLCTLSDGRRRENIVPGRAPNTRGRLGWSGRGHASPVLNLFGGHPASVGETYPRHLSFAFKFGVRMIVGGLACCVHGLFPFLFVTTGGRTVRELYAAILEKRFRSLTQGGDIPKPDFEI
jgi:hypothetical protein